jgi:Saccharopine dehydrogenase and related proteins
MKHVLVLGATGGIGHWVTKLLAEKTNIQQTVYVRTPEKLDTEIASHVQVIQGDVLDTKSLSEIMQGKDIVVAALSGDWFGQAKSIAEAMKELPIQHIFWVTGLGIHREVPGRTGELLEYYVNRFPEYIQAAELIAGAGIPCTLVRAANLQNGSNMVYYVQQEGEPVHGETVDRCAVAKYITDCIVENTDLSENASVGITN